MQPLPHNYQVKAQAEYEGNIRLGHGDLVLETNAPPNFGGPDGLWSPEELLVASVVDCFILTFRAIARAAKLDWSSLNCSANGVLDKLDGQMQFTHINLEAVLVVPGQVDLAKSERLLQRAEQGCLITNSLKSSASLTTTVKVA